MTTTDTYTIKPGSIFRATWGYDQTNVDFFQVVSVSGAYVRVRQVEPDVTHRDQISYESEFQTVEITDKILQPASWSIFIKDNVNGDRKKVNYSMGQPFIKVGHTLALLVPEGKLTSYVSWD